MLIIHFEYTDIFILTRESYCLVGSLDDKPEV